MKCEYCGANLTPGTAGLTPAAFIWERREQWPEVARIIYEGRVRRCEETAQGILDARALYPDKSLAWLYDEATMPPELREAHRLNDLAVMELYGFSPDMTEPEIVAELFRMYEEMTGEALRWDANGTDTRNLRRFIAPDMRTPKSPNVVIIQ